MANRKTSSKKATTTSANVGHEAQLWQMADALRGSMDAAEYKGHNHRPQCPGGQVNRARTPADIRSHGAAVP